MQEVVRKVMGSSSVALDRHLGRPIEKLDAPWRAWIRQQVDASTQAAAPRVH